MQLTIVHNHSSNSLFEVVLNRLEKSIYAELKAYSKKNPKETICYDTYFRSTISTKEGQYSFELKEINSVYRRIRKYVAKLNREKRN
jgi:hypothetical protein